MNNNMKYKITIQSALVNISYVVYELHTIRIFEKGYPIYSAKKVHIEYQLYFLAFPKNLRKSLEGVTKQCIKTDIFLSYIGKVAV